MNATQLLKELYAAGIFPEIVDGGRIAIPAGAITDAQRQAIKRHKQELLALLQVDTAHDETATNSGTGLWDASSHYYGHHLACRHCIAAGRGYGQRCEIGQQLWNALQTASPIDRADH
ncbi:hypothetical protein EHF36_07940 [Kerstersia gyiorum]|uniref:TubC N-terminal docking domain-related protein n=1 Tax=Kerstersia gyiorum TaxID=206506 RepID=UPI001070A569|nr:hypothetical protein [Kerstersia gyiorum]QBR40565.1 hypothetical protein EHF36_07940 [Kerstersia gyiorum]